MKRWLGALGCLASLAAAAQPQGRVVSEAELQQRAGKVLLFVAPEYPRSLVREGAEATVDVTGTVHPDGSFEARSFESSSPRREFRDAVYDVTRLWLLRPAYGSDCHPRASPVTVRVWFEVKQGQGSISVSQPVEPAADSAGLVLRRVSGDEPAYPYEARKLGLSADVESLLRVMPSGEVHSVTVVPGPVIRFFRRPVAETLMRWRFDPHAAGGSVCYRVEHRFRAER